jgi:hypothetical protein
MAQHQKRISTDKFGNPYQLIGCKVNDKGFSKGFIELGGKLYKVEPSQASKEGVSYWVKVTEMKKQAAQKM